MAVCPECNTEISYLRDFTPAWKEYHLRIDKDGQEQFDDQENEVPMDHLEEQFDCPECGKTLFTDIDSAIAFLGKEMDRWEQVGVVAVDSGSLLLTDYPGQPEVKEYCERQIAAGCPKALQLNFDLGHPGAGVAVATGLGDGLYPVFARIGPWGEWGERVKEIKVVFDPHPVLGKG